jgi:hypothetical protein
MAGGAKPVPTAQAAKTAMTHASRRALTTPNRSIQGPEITAIVITDVYDPAIAFAGMFTHQPTGFA